MKLDDLTATIIGGVDEIEIRFKLDPAILRELATGLQRAFAAQKSFVNWASAIIPANHECNQRG